MKKLSLGGRFHPPTLFIAQATPFEREALMGDVIGPFVNQSIKQLISISAEIRTTSKGAADKQGVSLLVGVIGAFVGPVEEVGFVTLGCVGLIEGMSTIILIFGLLVNMNIAGRNWA